MDEMIEKRSYGYQIAQNIKEMIFTQKLKSGDRIPEEEIANMFQVSRTPIREALRKLEEQGLVKIYPHRYATVVKLDHNAKEHIGQVRIALDVLSVQLLAEKISDEQCDKLIRIAKDCIVFGEEVDKIAIFEKDSEFHLTLAKMTDNPYLYDIQKSLNLKVQLLRSTMYINLEEIKEGIKLHIPIVEALREHDADKASELMRTHLEQFYEKEPQ
jgi:DNA-binding GntR family transcriptional regulator